tara:strand:+ start:595 stop:711 length:117 start_codon:yes stop_codon:yes gene_type:complete
MSLLGKIEEYVNSLENLVRQLQQENQVLRDEAKKKGGK